MVCHSDQQATMPAGRLTWLVALVAGLLGCEAERPRSYSEYLEDPIAREATLLRCNAERERSRGDAECINAKRAAAALAAQDDGEKRRRFEAESERKREALRARIGARQAAERRSQEEARRRAEAAYEESWSYDQMPPAEGVGAGIPDEPGVYTGRQFPAQPLQPGVSSIVPEPDSGGVADASSGFPAGNYPLHADSTGSTDTPETTAGPSEPTSPPNEVLPDTTPPVPSQDVPGASEEPDSGQMVQPSEEWQPFEPPPANQPAEG